MGREACYSQPGEQGSAGAWGKAALGFFCCVREAVCRFAGSFSSLRAGSADVVVLISRVALRGATDFRAGRWRLVSGLLTKLVAPPVQAQGTACCWRLARAGAFVVDATARALPRSEALGGALFANWSHSADRGLHNLRRWLVTRVGPTRRGGLFWPRHSSLRHCSSTFSRFTRLRQGHSLLGAAPVPVACSPLLLRLPFVLVVPSADGLPFASLCPCRHVRFVNARSPAACTILIFLPKTDC